MGGQGVQNPPSPSKITSVIGNDRNKQVYLLLDTNGPSLGKFSYLCNKQLDPL